MVKEVLRAIIAEPFTSPAHTTLDIAIMTRDKDDAPANVPQKIRLDLEPIFGRFLAPKPKGEKKEKESKEKNTDKPKIPNKLRDPSEVGSKKAYTKEEFQEFYGKKAGAKKWGQALDSYKAAKKKN